MVRARSSCRCEQRAGARRKPVRARQDDRWKIFSGTANDALAKDICEFPRIAARQGMYQALLRRRDVRPDRGERARRRCLHGAAHLRSGRCAPDAVAVADRCAEARVSPAHHGGDSVLRLRPAGPQGQAACSDFVEAGGRSVDHRGSRSRVGCRSARAADPGLFQYPGGPFVCVAGAGGALQGAEPFRT